VTGIDTTRWLLAGIAACGRCAQPLTMHVYPEASRWYACQPCGHWHRAEPVEHQVAATVRERDWMVAQHTGTREVYIARWSAGTDVEVWGHLNRLVDRVTVGPNTDCIHLRWRPEAALPPDCPWLGIWASPIPERALLGRVGDPPLTVLSARRGAP
jgi:hypothetical protein